ncbi:hypothetical protein IC007_2350 [Sulfuracidifex tepidarius]|uniref:Uncharacterized protein n=1 Tax=Sulfuracidifex tepidarius TaxID=1294262 RepID=A0A510E5P7_9CREN|nr:hypothetical protein IC007_2350 [Sulfuracidifex tepidarius]
MPNQLGNIFAVNLEIYSKIVEGKRALRIFKLIKIIMNKKTLLILSFILLSIVITVSAILTHIYISAIQICITIEILNSIQIHYYFTIYYDECITWICCIISLLACIYCILLANNVKFDEIRKLEERIFSY